MLNAREKLLRIRKDNILIPIDLWLTQQYSDDGKFYLAKKHIEEALNLLAGSTDEYQQARAYALHGNLLSVTGNFAGGQEELMKAIRLFEKVNKPRAIGAVYINLGNNYSEINDQKKAFSCFRKAQLIALEFHDTGNYLTALNSLGSSYLRSNLDSAVYCFNKILEFPPKQAWLMENLAARFQMAGILYERKNYQAALTSYFQILESCRKNSIDKGIYRAFSGIGNVYEALNQDKDALRIFQEAYSLAREAGETPTAINVLEAVLYMHKKAGDHAQALATLEQIKALSDSLRSLDKQLSLHDLELMYNNEKAERRNEELNSNMLLMKRSIQAKNIILAITVFFILTLCGLLYAIYQLYRQRELAYQSLIEKYRQDIKMHIQPEILPSYVEVETSQINDQFTSDDTTFDQLIHYFDKEKPFLNPQLKIEDVANSLNIPRKTLSTSLADRTGMHFISFVNDYRVREALKLLGSPDYQNIKIEHIARKSGFGSKVSFYSAFTQATGYKPSSYREKN
jgi:AraC-like DNA-binding protein